MSVADMSTSADTSLAALSVRGIAKAFPGTQALDEVSFDVARGHFHALVGGNGSGKSTLIKILAGVQPADEGSFSVEGETIDAVKVTPLDARRVGLQFVHQHRSTFPALSVAENVSIGRGFERDRFGRIKWGAVRQRVETVLERFAIDAGADDLLSELSAPKQTMVAIARALQDQEEIDRGVLVLDEPTASLAGPEVDVLLSALRRYAAAGQTILYVTHRLEEVLDTADRVTVLRDGHLVDTIDGKGLTHDRLVRLIAGRSIDQVFPDAQAPPATDIALEVRGLRGGPLKGVDLDVCHGEIVGLAGLMGSGRTSLFETVFGVHVPSDGVASCGGRPLRPGRPREAMRAGIAYVPEDRAEDAAFHALPLSENMSIAVMPEYWRGGRLRHHAEKKDARGLMRQFAIKAAHEDVPFDTLSGGNQQKAVLARWLRRRPSVLLLDEPTQGVDVGSRAEIYVLIRRAAESGTAVLLACSDLEELVGLCDRAVVIAGGRTVANLVGDELRVERLHELAFERGAA